MFQDVFKLQFSKGSFQDMLGQKQIKKSDWMFISPTIGPGDRIFFSCKRLTVSSVYANLHY